MPTPARTAIVTGAARGLGGASAVALSQRGFAVALVDIDGAGADAAASQISAGGGTTLHYAADVSDFARAREVVTAVFEAWGRIDVLVNNAGMPQPKGLLDLSEAEWDRTIDVNLKSCFNWCKPVAEIMLAQGSGRIINISSISAHTGGVTSAVSKFAYAASKAGILGLTRALAKELGPQIAVNAICPGTILTAPARAMVAKGGDAIVSRIPLGRVGQPEDVGEVVAFLATLEPNFITGEDIVVNGGQWMN